MPPKMAKTCSMWSHVCKWLHHLLKLWFHIVIKKQWCFTCSEISCLLTIYIVTLILQSYPPPVLAPYLVNCEKIWTTASPSPTLPHRCLRSCLISFKCAIRGHVKFGFSLCVRQNSNLVWSQIAPLKWIIHDLDHRWGWVGGKEAVVQIFSHLTI